MDARIDFRNIVRAAGLQKDNVAVIAQDGHQRKHILLEQRLATRDLDKGTPKRRYRVGNLFESLFFAFVKRVLGIAIVTAKIAEGQTHKYARSPHPGALSLNGVINLVNGQCLFWFWHSAAGSMVNSPSVKTSYVNNRKANFAGEYASSANWSRTVQWLGNVAFWLGDFYEIFSLTGFWCHSSLAAMRLGFALTSYRSAPAQRRMARKTAGEITRPALAFTAGIFFAAVLAAQAQESVEPDILPSLTEPPAASAEPLPSSDQAFPSSEPLATTSYTVAQTSLVPSAAPVGPHGALDSKNVFPAPDKEVVSSGGACGGFHWSFGLTVRGVWDDNI